MSMTGSMTSTTTTLPTPAHSVNGSSLLPEMAHDVVMGEDSPHKRKRGINDVGGRGQEKVDVEGRKFGIADLHLDVGEKYLLCRTRKPPFSPLKPASVIVAPAAASLPSSHLCLAALLVA